RPVMKKMNLSKLRLLMLAAVAGTALILVSWDFRQQGRHESVQQSADTLPQPGKRDGRVRNLDEAIAELDRVDVDMELEKAMKEVRQALKEVDMQKINLEVQKAMKEIDMERIQKEIEASMAKVDMK